MENKKLRRKFFIFSIFSKQIKMSATGKTPVVKIAPVPKREMKPTDTMVLNGNATGHQPKQTKEKVKAPVAAEETTTPTKYNLLVVNARNEDAKSSVAEVEEALEKVKTHGSVSHVHRLSIVRGGPKKKVTKTDFYFLLADDKVKAHLLGKSSGFPYEVSLYTLN